MHVIAAKAVCFDEARAGFRDYQEQIVANAARLARRSPAGFRMVSGGTDNHLMLVDVASKGLTGKVAEARSDRPASRSTRTRSRSTRTRRWWRAASASARRP